MTITITAHIEPDTAAALQNLQAQITALIAPAPDVISWPTIQSVNLTQGVAATVQLPRPTSSLGLPLTVSLLAALQPGVTFDPVSFQIKYDGIGAVANVTETLKADDGRTP